MCPLQFKLVGPAFHWRGEPLVVFRAERAKRQRHIGPGIVHDMNVERLAVGPFRRAADQGADARVPRIKKGRRRHRCVVGVYNVKALRNEPLPDFAGVAIHAIGRGANRKNRFHPKRQL